MSTCSKALSTVLAALLLFAGATATFAYTLVFKDGSTLVVKDKYRVEGDRALARLLSGTETFFALDDLDLSRTDEVNKQNLGSARVLDGHGTRPLERDPENRDPRTLRDLVRDRGDATPGIFAKPKASSGVRQTPSGNLDLFSLPGDALASAETTEELTQLFARHGVAAAVRRGSADSRILLQIITNTRAEVFAALTGAAAGMVELRSRMPEVGLVEITMATDSRSRAGMFVLGHEDAVALASGKVEPERFFVDKVLF